MATIVSSAAGPPPPPPPLVPPPPNWKSIDRKLIDRPYLENHAKTKRRKKDEKAQVGSIVWRDIFCHMKQSSFGNGSLGERWIRIVSLEEGHAQCHVCHGKGPKRGLRKRRRAAALETAERNSTHQQSPVGSVSEEAT
ncbi:hypothetical protein N7449_003914 [Penicillium cf. viridicatum]|uniref:Uncharacterized protein n=1 Tax=Penicillium cf. viridicatum TaxID=2972119 RepID=A0A9W9MYA6_9EURO|nr:hypothetical protein N7449_003914 [Penicillium cf. viridicatum]